MDDLRWIEIFKSGSHTSSNGLSRSYPPEELHQVVEGYDPAVFKAPLIVSYPAHNTAGHSDGDLHKSQLAYGYPEKLKVAGDRLLAGFNKLSSQVKDWIKDGAILGFSSSFYLPSSPFNPTPGKLALRHIAACGIDPPAVKGMTPPELAEPLSAFANYSDSQEGSVEFALLDLEDVSLEDVRLGQRFYQAIRSVDVAIAADYGELEAQGMTLLRNLYQRLRDREIEETGLEAADRRFPLYEVESLSEMVASQRHQPPSVTWGDLEVMRDRLDALEAIVQKPLQYQEEPPAMPNEEIEFLQAKNATLEAQVNELREARERDRVTSFVEARITERQVHPNDRDREIHFILSLPNSETANYGEGLGDMTARSAYMAKLEAAKPLWGATSGRLPIYPIDAPEYNEGAVHFPSPPGYDADPAAMAVYQKAKRYQAEKSCSFSEAVAAVNGGY